MAHDTLAMNVARSTRSSVLGKRAYQHQEASSTASITPCDQQLQTPDATPNAKRVRTSLEMPDSDANKENVSPFSPEVAMDISSPTSVRALRRTTTEFITPSRTRRGKVQSLYGILGIHAPYSAGGSLRRASTSIIPSAPATPTGEISHLVITTPPPTPPTSLLSLHARARALLRSTCNNTNGEVAGRDVERATIHGFLMSFLNRSNTEFGDDHSTSLYISGSPGTGKTALVNAVLRSMPTDAKVVFVNCMALNSIDALWERLIEEFGDANARKPATRGKKLKGREVIEGLISKHDSKWFVPNRLVVTFIAYVPYSIIILDELDHITPTTQSLTALFSLPNTTPAKLRLIGIANTHTLSVSSSSTSSVAASRNVQTIHFAPYTPPQLLQVLQTRLQPLHDVGSADEKIAAAAKRFLPLPPLTLLTKKIAATTGDVRSLFGVLRGAIDLAVIAASSLNKGENPLDTPAPTVTPTHILAALKAYTPSSTSTSMAQGSSLTNAAPTMTKASSSSSEIVVKVTNLGLQARLVLLCILLASRRLEAGLPLTASKSSSPSKKASTSPMKRSSSLPTSNATVVGIDPGQLHTYYSSAVEGSDHGVSEPVSRSEFSDLVGVLDGIGLIFLEGGSDVSPGTGARRAFGRSASFAGGAGFGGAGRGKGKGDVRIAKGVRTDEVLRGLGISSSGEAPAPADVQQEVLRALWEAEKAKLARELKVAEKQKQRAKAIGDGFDGASED